MTVEHLHPWIPNDTFGNRLVLVRRQLGMSVKEAARTCGLHYATWSTWENGRKPADMAVVVDAISSHLGVDRGWLMWGQTNNAPRPGGPKGVEDAESVRHQGLEPRTRWLGATLRLVRNAERAA